MNDMTHKETALEFLRCFSRGDLKTLGGLLGEEFRFRGPRLRCDSRREYLEALAADPPDPSEFEIIGIVGEGREVGVFYEYRKQGVTTAMAQWCRFQGDKISDLLLVFDSRAFA